MNKPKTMVEALENFKKEAKKALEPISILKKLLDKIVDRSKNE